MMRFVADPVADLRPNDRNCQVADLLHRCRKRLCNAVPGWSTKPKVTGSNPVWRVPRCSSEVRAPSRRSGRFRKAVGGPPLYLDIKNLSHARMRLRVGLPITTMGSGGPGR